MKQRPDRLRFPGSEAASSRPGPSVGCLLLTALLGALGACTDALPSATDVAAKGSLRRAAAPPRDTTSRTTREFKISVLGALLVPLLDDEVVEPSRWVEPSSSVDCDNATVTIDGAPPDINAPVPDAFTVRWQMDRCTPFGPGLEVSGEVELHVESGPGGYVARVVPERLVLKSAEGIDVLTEAFSASLVTHPEALPLSVARAPR